MTHSIWINSNLQLPWNELKFTASRSSGPGGQNVNKVNTCVHLHFDVIGSPSLDSIQKSRIMEKLANRINQQCILSITCQQERSQRANKETAIVRFIGLLKQALRQPKPRQPTQVPRKAKEKRLAHKKDVSLKKRARQEIPEE